MSTAKPDTPPRRAPLIEWLVALNAQVSSWAAATTWKRLFVLFVIVMAAGAILGDLLHLRHERVHIRRSVKGDDVQISISEKDGIQISRRPDRAASGSTDADASAVPKPAIPPKPGADPDEEDDEDIRMISKQVFTVRGLIGDIGAALITIAFAYLIAAKIVVRKVAQADAKVKSAEVAAEHEAMERQLVQARLQVLQAQVEPHFLFNTLGAIDYLIETDPKRASQMQKALITYLRGALPQMRQESSTLGRELRLIRSFLELIKMRMEDRLEVEFLVPEGTESAEFPPMMLQSLVENAIKHGIEPKPEGGKVTVAARIQNGQLWVEVKDTGVGIPSTDRLEGPTSGTGLGLQNIRERLTMLYPGRSRLILVSDDTQGTSVKIVVPYQVGPEIARNFDAAGEGRPA